MKRLTFTIVLFLLIVFTYSCDENTSKNNDLKKTETLTVPEENTTKTNETIPNNDLTKMGFYGDIETIVETEYKLSTKFGEDFIDGIKSKTITKFNNDGNKIEENRYGSDWELEKKDKYTYDEKGNVIDGTVYDSNGEFSLKMKMNYDEKGNMIEHNSYLPDGKLFMSLTYTYDENGNEIEQNTYVFYEWFEWKDKRKNTYDENGDRIERNCYDSNGNLCEKYTYTYDENCNMIEEYKYGSDGVLEKKDKYTYDEKGNMIEKRSYEVKVNNVLEEPISLIKYEITYR